MITDLTLTEETDDDNPKNLYELTVEFEHGDSDSEEKVVSYFKKEDKEHLIKYSNEINGWMEKDRKHKLVRDEYWNWALEIKYGYEEDDDNARKAPWSEYHCRHGKPTEVNCKYYDEKGKRFNVNLKKEPE